MSMFHYFGLFLGWVSVFHRYPVFSFLLSDMFSQKLWQKKSWWANHNSFGLR